MNASIDDRHNALLASLGERVLAAVGDRSTPNAEGLRAVLRRCARYLEVEGDKALMVSARTLVFAMIEEGREGASDMTNGHAAMWLAGWLAALPPPPFPDLSEYATDPERLDRAVSRGVELWMDHDVMQVLADATALAGAVRAMPSRASHRIALRHLVAVCLKPVERGGLLGAAALELNRPLGADGLRRARDDFLAWVTRSLTSTETAELWAAAMMREGLLEAGSQAEPEGAVGPPLVATFAPDRPASDPDGPDPLRINKDVTAFARLIACKDTSTPLAIGVFGAWGSGKSTFMERLEKSIDQLAAPGREGAVEDGFVASVVHIRFNAWSFADANLWASLGAEFFDQLRVGGHSKLGSKNHAELVERVTTHVHDLKSTAEETRAVAHAGERALAAAQQARDKAVKEVRDGATPAGLTQALLDGMARAHETFKAEFGDRKDDLGRLVTTARDVQSSAGRTWTALKLLARGDWRTIAPVVLFAAGLAGAFGLHQAYPMWLGDAWTAVGAVPGVAGLAAAFGSGLRWASRFASETAGFGRQLREADAKKLEAVLKAELALKDAAEEADARRKAAERATRALSRYIDPQGTSNPPRLLRYVLEDDPATRALEKEIGLISRTRRVFEAVDEILQKDREARANGQEVDRDTPERIVIYIDDLDRCTQEQVQAVLQAVHLLLAFESFVVVVGVDQTRVAEALARQFDDDDDPNNDPKEEVARRMDRAVLYLEKIFQLAFRLQPLSPAGEDGGAYSRFMKELIGPTAEEKAEVEAAKAKADSEKAAAEKVAAEEVEKAGPPPEGELAKLAKQLARTSPSVELPPTPTAPPAPPEPPKVSARQALETLVIGQAEADFLRTVAIGTVAGSTPRNVKRMLNVYRLARVRLAEDGFDLTGKGGGRPLYPLLALFAALDTGRAPKVAKAAFDALKVDKTPLGDVVRLALPDDDVMITKAVEDAYGEPVFAADCRHVADLVRRYSFNALDH